MLIRRLNDNGLGEFERYVRHLKEGKPVSDPEWMLTDDRTSEPVPISVDVDDMSFPSRYEMGAYLCSKFAAHNIQPYIGDRGFWSWLALFWFDQLCPEKGGKRSPAMPYN